MAVCELSCVWEELRSSIERTCDADVDCGSGNREAGVDVAGRSMGSRSLVSFIEMTIFSRSIGVMCFSRPRLRLLSEDSCRLSSGRAFGMRGVIVDEVVSTSRSSSDEVAESRLDDSAGSARSPLAAAASERERRWEGALREAFDFDSGAQQNVSRFQRRQLRFSRRLPSSIACEVFENNDHCGDK